MSSAVIVGSVLYLLFSCTVCLFLAGVIALREAGGRRPHRPARTARTELKGR